MISLRLMPFLLRFAVVFSTFEPMNDDNALNRCVPSHVLGGRGRLTMIVAALLLTLSMMAAPVAADVEAGIAAFESGDFKAAAAEFQKQSGDAKAAYHMGLMHERGLGELLRNYSTALNWFERAGRAGNIEALLKAASMHEQGIGVPVSHRKAAEWYKRAAEKSDARAQYRLGTMYRDGIGLPRDRYRAILWLGRAGEQGNAAAIGALEELRRQGLLSRRELVARLAGIPLSDAPLTERGKRVRDQLADILDPVRFRLGESVETLAAKDLRDHWLIVEREEDVLALLPDASVLTDDGAIVEVGTIRIVAASRSEDVLDYTITLPLALTIRDPSGQVTGTVSHDLFEIVGAWSEILQTSLTANIRWSAVRAVFDDGDVEIDADEVSGHFDLIQQEPAIWRQASGFEIKDVHGRSARQQSEIRIGRVAFRSEVDGAHPEVYKNFVGRYVPGFEGSQRRIQEAPSNPETQQAESTATIAAVMGRRFETSLELSELRATPSQNSPAMGLRSAAFLVGMYDLDQQLSGFELNFRYDGLVGAVGEESDGQAVTSDKDAGPPASIPEHATLDIVVERLPARALAETLFSGFLQAWAGSFQGGDGASGRAAESGSAERMPMAFGASAELAKAGTRVVLNRLEVGGDGFGLIGNGTVAADPAAALQVVGGYDVTVTNLREVVARTRVHTLLFGGEVLLEVLEEIGRPGARDDIKHYRVEVAESGTVLINGHDVRTLLERTPEAQ